MPAGSGCAASATASIGDGVAGASGVRPGADWGWMLVTPTKLPSESRRIGGGNGGSEPSARPPGARIAVESGGAAPVGDDGAGGEAVSPTAGRGWKLVTPTKLPSRSTGIGGAGGRRGSEPSTRLPGAGAAAGSGGAAPVDDEGAGGGEVNPIAEWGWMLVTPARLRDRRDRTRPTPCECPIYPRCGT